MTIEACVCAACSKALIWVSCPGVHAHVELSANAAVVTPTANGGAVAGFDQARGPAAAPPPGNRLDTGSVIAAITASAIPPDTARLGSDRRRASRRSTGA